jgi:hypothetical protein
MILTIADFYNLPTLFTINKPIAFLIQRGFLKEITNGTGTPNYQTLANFESKNVDSKIEIRVHKALQANLSSVMPVNQWQQASVWYNQTPCMIIRNTEPNLSLPQDSYPKHFITDETTHKAMVYYIFSFIQEDRVIDQSVRNQGVWDKRLLYDDRLLDAPQQLHQPQVYDLQLATEAINL